MKNDMNDDFRLYGLVPYNIMPIQKGIQFGHALQELNNLFLDSSIMDTDNLPFNISDPDFTDGFHTWRWQCKTFIILNGGTTGNQEGVAPMKFHGSLNNHVETLKEMKYPHAIFHEPDLGNQLSAVVFIVPKEVYNTKEFPNFIDWLKKEIPDAGNMLLENLLAWSSALEEEEDELYKLWVESIGGEKNVAMRNFASKFELAK